MRVPPKSLLARASSGCSRLLGVRAPFEGSGVPFIPSPTAGLAHWVVHDNALALLPESTPPTDRPPSVLECCKRALTSGPAEFEPTCPPIAAQLPYIDLAKRLSFPLARAGASESAEKFGASLEWGKTRSRRRIGISPGLELPLAQVHVVAGTPSESLSTWAPEAAGVGGKDKIAVIGSGNWGSVAVKLIATNARSHSVFHEEVRMWVFEETLPSGEKLTEVINRTKENVKYLPNIKLGPNVIADPDLEHTVKDATMLIFVTPHQFVEGICKRLKGKVTPGTKAISLIKGMEVKREGPCMVSSMISEQLGIDCSVLMGANIANEVAMEKFSEATVGYRSEKSTADKWVKIFGTPYFRVTAVQDVEGVELCGTLKNVVAIAAGLVDGLDMGNNSKAAIMRIGLLEMQLLSQFLFPSVKDATFFESCGVADLITTCFGGRNRKVADAFARCGGKRSFDELEAELLAGQKLQGVLTAREVSEVLKARGWEEVFPLFSTVHAIATGSLPPSAIVEYSEYTPRKITGVAPAQYV